MSAESSNDLVGQSVSAAQFEAIVEIAADAIISIDDSHNIVLFNRGAEEIFGYRSTEMRGQSLSVLLPKRFRAAHASHVSSFAASSTTARRMGERREIYGLRRDGTEFPAEASISKLDVGGRWIFTVVLRDVSDRKHAEEEKSRLLDAEREARRIAESATKMRDEILGVVSHDLRNPLSVITMCAGALQGELAGSDPRVVEAVTTIRDAASWMQRMVKDLLDVASIEAGRLAVEIKPLDLVITLVKAIDSFELDAADRGIKLIQEIPERLPIVTVDGDRVLQLLANLLGNAMKFTAPGGTITLRARPENNHLTVSVIDTGTGIPAEEIPMLFDRFWQSRRSANVRGHGLGLAIAKGIVHAHAGRIWVDSEPGKGSAFHFTLPLWSGNAG